MDCCERSAEGGVEKAGRGRAGESVGEGEGAAGWHRP